jgi:tetratricopeptide (TPR) repeat protein
MMFSFQYDKLLWLLLLLPILVAIYFYAFYKKKQVFKKLGDEALVKELTGHYNKKSFPIKFILVLVAIGLILLSIANLRLQKAGEKVSRNGIDIMIALDVSKSMLAQDVKPNRLDRAKQLLNKLIDKLSNDRIGIIVFAGRAYLQMPLTGDHSATKMYLAAATPETVPAQGTVIADALRTCNAAFNAKDKKYKAVILISDGEDHDENAISVAEEMADQGVVINTVGIGSPEGSEIIDELTNEPKKDKEGNIVITKLNESALTEIAKKGNGNYQMYTNADAVASSLYAVLSTLDKRNVTDESILNYQSFFQYLLGLALLLLVLEFFISEIKKNKKTTMKIATAFLLLFTATNGFAQTEKTTIKKGNEAYKKKDYQTAINKYNEVIKKNDSNTVAQNNLGSALYKSSKKEDAVIAFDKAANKSNNTIVKSNALYNKAVVLQNDKKLEDCIANYKNALKLNPTNEDARHNLQLALKQQQQKKQEEQQKKDKKDDKKEKEPKDEKKEDEPKPNKSNLSKKEAEQKLKALLQKEKALQDKLHKSNANNANKQDKDW